MREKAKQVLSFVLRFGLSAGLLIYLFRKNDIGKTVEIAKDADFFYLLAALVCVFAVYGVILVRWAVIIKALELRLARKEVVRWFFIGTFFNFVLPTSTGGDIIKAIGLCQDTRDRAKVVASIVLDRILGFISITIVALVSYFVARKIADEKFLFNGIIVLFLVSWGGFLFLVSGRLYSLACGLFNRWASVREKLWKLHQAFALIKEKLPFALLAIVISSLAQVLLGLSYFLTAKGLHQDADLVYCIAFAPLICVASSLPSIGGLGFRENATVLLFMKIGMTRPAAVSLSLLNLFYAIVVGLVGAIVYVCKISARRLQRDPSDPASHRANNDQGGAGVPDRLS